MSVRQQNFRQSECLPIVGTGAAASGLAYQNGGSPGANPLAAMRYVNPTTVTAYFISGRGTATATVPTGGTSSPMTPVLAGEDMVVDVDPAHNFVSGILGVGTATGTLFACPGEGS